MKQYISEQGLGLRRLDEIVGRDDFIQDQISLFMSCKQPTLVYLSGEGGIGKTVFPCGFQLSQL